MSVVMRMQPDINYIIQESLKGDKIYVEILLKRLNPVIFKNIYTYWSPSDPLTQDLQQEGYMIILQSLKDFDTDRKVHFLQYVKIRLYYFYKDYFKKSIKNDALSMDHLYETGRELISDCRDQLTSIILKEEEDSLHKCIDELSEKEQMIISLFYFRRLSIQEIADKLGIKYRAVINIKSNAVRKLRRKMSKLLFQ
ncbi:MAG: sigma-70 family RNA polymerase sigma factor [Sedimentibacter sp.]|jgi:RNA polymerase sporulation-specific sigma factor